MSSQIHHLLEQALKVAEERGVTQREAARLGGISPVGLSKAKRRGDLMASTLEAIGEAMGLELVFVPKRGGERERRATDAIRAGTFFSRGKESS